MTFILNHNGVAGTLQAVILEIHVSEDVNFIPREEWILALDVCEESPQAFEDLTAMILVNKVVLDKELCNVL